LDLDDWAIPPIAPPKVRAGQPNIKAAKALSTGPVAGIEDCSSPNEIDALVRKAARGSGLSWGLAEEVGKGARALASAGEAYLPLVADVLEAQRDGLLSRCIVADGAIWRATDRLPVNPLVLGPSLADHAFLLEEGPLDIEGPLGAPALLLPFVATVARHLGAAVKVSTDRGEFVVSGFAVAGAPPRALAGQVHRLRLAREKAAADDPPQPSTLIRAVSLPQGLKERFETLAALTYVPSSERSRATGAGAGLNDND
jgi:hypothetical protein